jgi:hypothetical protein
MKSKRKNIIYKKALMDPTSREKTSVVKREEFKKVFRNIPPNQLEVKYGGEMPNIEKFWPPTNTLHNHPFYVKNRERKKKKNDSSELIGREE